MGGGQLATFLGFPLFSTMWVPRHIHSGRILTARSHSNPTAPASSLPADCTETLIWRKKKDKPLGFNFSTFNLIYFNRIISLFKNYKSHNPFFFLLFQSLHIHSEREKERERSLFLHLLTSRNCYSVPNLKPRRWWESSILWFLDSDCYGFS